MKKELQNEPKNRTGRGACHPLPVRLSTLLLDKEDSPAALTTQAAFVVSLVWTMWSLHVVHFSEHYDYIITLLGGMVT